MNGTDNDTDKGGTDATQEAIPDSPDPPPESDAVNVEFRKRDLSRTENDPSDQE